MKKNCGNLQLSDFLDGSIFEIPGIWSEWRFILFLKNIMASPIQNNPDGSEAVLLSNFNNRIEEDFVRVYSLFYEDLFYYATKLYHDTEIEPRDVIQDVFLSLWQAKSLKFESLTHIKAYLFVALRNNFKSFVNHHRYIEKYQTSQLLDKDSFEADVIESELFSTFHYILGLLPEESAEILELFLSGWKVEEIALKLGKTKQTIYNKKSEAIIFLRNKLSKDTLILLLTFVTMA